MLIKIETTGNTQSCFWFHKVRFFPKRTALCFFYETIFCCINLHKYIEFIIENTHAFKRSHYFIANTSSLRYVGLKSCFSKSSYSLGMTFLCLFIKTSCHTLGIFFIKEAHMCSQTVKIGFLQSTTYYVKSSLQIKQIQLE